MSGKPSRPIERVSVLIASLGRQGLIQTLESVNRIRVPNGYVVEVIVVDDSADKRVAPLIAGREWRFPLRVIELGLRNVAHARNALLDAADGDWGMFVDDDEHVDVDWLDGHMRAASAFQADAVFGPVLFNYPDATPRWFKDADPMWKDIGWSQNGKVVPTGATNNTMVRMSMVRRLGLRFDPTFGRSGGEDEDFFSRMAKAGCKLVLTDWALVWEDVPLERATPAYILERAERTGANFARRTLAGASLSKRTGFAFNAFAKLLIAGTAAAVAFGRRQRFRFHTMARSNIGKLRAIVGHHDGDGWASEIEATRSAKATARGDL